MNANSMLALDLCLAYGVYCKTFELTNKIDISNIDSHNTKKKKKEKMHK